MKQINEPSDNIRAAYTRWKRNRDMIAGEDAVKAAGELYLARLGDQTPKEYEAYKKRIPFYPAASRTHDGLLGLVTRKNGEFKCPPGLEDIFHTVTRAGHTVDDLTEEAMSEVLKVGFFATLVDSPSGGGVGTTVAEAEAMGLRPFVATYLAESILEVTPGVINNRQKVVRVRLLDDEDTVRELVLNTDTGRPVYQVIIHRRDGDQWIAEPPVTPTRKGEPLSEIPFTLYTPKARAFGPVKGPLDDICQLNVHCFQAEAQAANSRYFASAPIAVFKGAEQEDITISPGVTLFFPGHSQTHPVEAGYMEFQGAGQANLEAAVATRKEEMAKLGSSILAHERPAAEAAETHAIRRSSENAVLASLARTVSRQEEETLNWVAWWAGYEKGSVVFKMNTDFVPQPMTAQERTATLNEYLSGVISLETYYDIMIAGEILPDGFDKEAEKQKLAQDSADADRALAMASGGE